MASRRKPQMPDSFADPAAWRDYEARTMTEKRLQSAIVACAQNLGYLAYHTFLSSRSAPGFPDLFLVRPASDGVPGRAVVIECKTEEGRVSPAQEIWLLAFASCGIPSLVARPSAWLAGEVEKFLRG